MNFRLRQWHVYLVMWLWVILYPIISRLLNNSIDFKWSDVLVTWLNMLPFLILFLIHNHLIIPYFPLPRRIVPYLAVTLTLLLLFTMFQYWRFDPYPFSRGMRPFVTMEQEVRPPGEFKDALPPDRLYPEKPRLEESHKPLPKRTRAPGYIMDCVIALLMLGCNQMVVLLFRVQREQTKLQQMEKENLQHELDYLKAQIKPHFLMNTLNNIHSMIEVDPQQAQEMVINLSKLLRYALYEGGKRSVLLSQEVAFISSYVEMMQQRCSGKKVSINLSLPERISDKIEVPPLLFIVFIENAFKHGISYRQASFIDVSLLVTQEGRVQFACENSIPPIKEDTPLEGGIGLENVSKRLNLLYAEDYSLYIKQTDKTYKVTLNIPTYEEKHTLSGS